jgi:hypothetical protein
MLTMYLERISNPREIATGETFANFMLVAANQVCGKRGFKKVGKNIAESTLVNESEPRTYIRKVLGKVGSEDMPSHYKTLVKFFVEVARAKYDPDSESTLVALSGFVFGLGLLSYVQTSDSAVLAKIEHLKRFFAFDDSTPEFADNLYALRRTLVKFADVPTCFKKVSGLPTSFVTSAFNNLGVTLFRHAQQFKVCCETVDLSGVETPIHMAMTSSFKVVDDLQVYGLAPVRLRALVPPELFRKPGKPPKPDQPRRLSLRRQSFRGQPTEGDPSHARRPSFRGQPTEGGPPHARRPSFREQF